MADLDKLDDPDYPAYTTGQAAQLLGVQVAFLHSLDAAGALRPERSKGGHRRYSRRQLTYAARLRALFDEGHTLAAATRITGLEDELAAAHDEIAVLQERLDGGPAADQP
ncbi:helix-turn-helix domain-containing protein [Saccharothrix sp.]|uniref:helix-turn-helix domain-containing protein n=1 Tax=Saccharothrix sp. TaxID=1873460 RepID=UPI0028121CFE|nr:helix-turn-helix domain-containing protein [Saccharothrix sp.]